MKKMFLELLVITFATYTMYCIYAFFSSQERTASVHCPVSAAETVVIKKDGSTTLSVQRHIEVRCAYAAAAVPVPQSWQINGNIGDLIYYTPDGNPDLFDSEATKHTAITKGDLFICTATWRSSLPFVIPPLNSSYMSGTRLQDCYVAPQS